MAIIITKRHFDKIIQHCKDYYPAEAGGFLGGKENVVLGIFPLPNLSYMYGVGAEKTSFKLADWDTIRTNEFFKQHNMDLIGFYHSHPTRELPIPSHKDFTAQRARHLRIMMLVSLADLKETKVATFTVIPRFSREKIKVIKDDAINKYLLEMDIKKSAEEYLREEQKLEGRAAEIIAEIIMRYEKDEKD